MTQSYPPHAGYETSQQSQPRNGFGITALVVGLITICLGLIPLFGLGAIIGGIVAVVFGLLGFARARRSVATNKKMSLIGTSAGLLAGALGIWGLVIVNNAFTDLDNAIKGAAPSAAAPAAPGAPADTNAPDQESTTGAFGRNITWPDGVAVTVSEPKAYRPSSSAATSQTAARYVSMTITPTNGSDKNIEATGTNLAVTANGTPADEVFDSAPSSENVADRLGAVGDREGEIDQHPSRIVPRPRPAHPCSAALSSRFNVRSSRRAVAGVRVTDPGRHPAAQLPRYPADRRAPPPRVSVPEVGLSL